MPAPEPIRRFTTGVFNPISRQFAGWLPWFGILVYAGRKSGRTYHTPINVFRHGDLYAFALTYGRDVAWVKNVQAAGGCEIVTRGHRIRLVEPQLFADETRHLMPPPVRLILRLMRVCDFVTMRAVQA
jgi:deazaflavin-dependent oxidoreductase (nitroreductase family)